MIIWMDEIRWIGTVIHEDDDNIDGNNASNAPHLHFQGKDMYIVTFEHV